MDKMEKASEKKKGFVGEFIDFLQTFGVIGLAIGFVIGVASSAVVTSLVKDIIDPIVGLVLPTGNLSSLNATVTSPVSGKPSVFLYGDFISPDDPVFPSSEWILVVCFITIQLSSMTMTTDPSVTSIP